MGPLWMMAYFEEGGLRSKPILLLTVDKNTEQPSEEEEKTPDREKKRTDELRGALAANFGV